MAAIEVRHLYKRFEQKGVTVEALSDINLTVDTWQKKVINQSVRMKSADMWKQLRKKIRYLKNRKTQRCYFLNCMII